MEVTFVVVMVIIFLFRNKDKSFTILVRVVDPVLFFVRHNATIEKLIPVNQTKFITVS